MASQMAHPHQINESGVCTSCETAVNEQHILECFICSFKYHGECNGVAPFTTKSFVNAFKKLRNNDNFVFICPHCKTERETTEASTMQQQMVNVLKAVDRLTKEVADLKNEKNADGASSATTVPRPSPSARSK